MARYRFALVGDPVAHSRSPAIHHALLELFGLEGDYTAIRADVAVLGQVVDQLAEGKWSGLNVTMPLKTAAALRADVLSPYAARSGSVNTLVMGDSMIKGHSTDSTTFDELTTSPGFEDVDPVLILGAGGSAAAALAALATGHRHIHVAARRSDQSDSLTGRLGGDQLPWDTPVAGALVINTTPIGMHGERLPSAVMGAASGLIDLPYGSRPTPAVHLAREMGLPVVDGHEFLLRQALASFRLWTGVALEYATAEVVLRNV